MAPGDRAVFEISSSSISPVNPDGPEVALVAVPVPSPPIEMGPFSAGTEAFNVAYGSPSRKSPIVVPDPTTAKLCHSFVGMALPAPLIWPLRLTNGTPLFSPITKEFAPSRRLKITALGASAAALIHADHVKEAPFGQASEGEAGTVTTPCPSSRRPPSISEPSTGAPAFCALLPDEVESVAG